jgi:6-phosphogluconolactonase
MDMKLDISPEPERSLAKALIEYLAGIEEPHIAVSGGSTPRDLYRLLAARYGKKIPWSRLTIFQVDERCVPPDDKQSNWRMLSKELLSKVDGVTAYRIEAERDGAAEDYERVLIEHAPIGLHAIPQLDLILLGMGGDGHTASLFPNTKALKETKRLVVRSSVPSLNADRITMTYPLINAARERWFLVRGADKAQAFQKIPQGKLPAAQIIDARWFIDPEAASAAG